MCVEAIASQTWDIFETQCKSACFRVVVLVLVINNNNNNNNIQDNVYGAVIMAEPLREFTRFI